MMKEQENVFYYITTMNENYSHPEMPEGAEEGIIKGMYLLHDNQTKSKQTKVQLLGSGTILREVIAAAEILAKDYNIEADIWSVTSFNELRREGMDVERWNRLHPEETPKQSFVSRCLKDKKGPIIATTDHMKIVSDQIRAFVPGDYTVLGTDGYGRSDSRENLRDFFEVDSKHIVVATLKALADSGDIKVSVVSEAIKKYAFDTEKNNPVYL